MWIFVGAAGVAASVFGVLYGECFGPTGLVPVVWLAPLDEPMRLLLVALAVGAVLLGVAYTVGAINRWREGGFRLAVYAPSGIAGARCSPASAPCWAGTWSAAGCWWRLGWRSPARSAAGLDRSVCRVRWRRGGASAGRDRRAGSGGASRVEPGVVRPSGSVRHDSRRAWLGGVARDDGTCGRTAGIGAVGAVVLFVMGNVVAFALEALVAGVQALRLEFYELFSRVFIGEGRPFRPWTSPGRSKWRRAC